MQYPQGLVLGLLSEAGWRKPKGGTALPDAQEKLGGSIARTVPEPESSRWHVQTGGEGKATAFVLDGGGDTPPQLYRASLRVDGENTTLDVEKLDLRSVTALSVHEEQHDEEGETILTSTWRIEFDGSALVEIHDEGIARDREPPGKPYQFGRALAEAAGWAPEHTH